MDNETFEHTSQVQKFFVLDENMVYRSAVAPDDISKLWFDTANDILKYWNEDENTWSPVNEDEIINSSNILKQTITEEYTSVINQVKDSINLNVQKLVQEIVGNENGEVSETVNSISTSLNVTVGQLEFVNTQVQEIADKITGLTTKEEISNWATLDSNGVLHLGTNRNNFETQLSNAALEFYESGTKVAWISNNELHQLKAVIEKSLQIGRWTWEDDKTYGLTLKWVGG